jgi:hypothetical protein
MNFVLGDFGQRQANDAFQIISQLGRTLLLFSARKKC